MDVNNRRTLVTALWVLRRCVPRLLPRRGLWCAGSYGPDPLRPVFHLSFPRLSLFVFNDVSGSGFVKSKCTLVILRCCVPRLLPSRRLWCAGSIGPDPLGPVFHLSLPRLSLFVLNDISGSGFVHSKSTLNRDESFLDFSHFTFHN